MIRVLILNERDAGHPRAGGAETHVMEIFSRLAARGMSVTLLCSAWPGAAPRDRDRGVEIRRLGRLPLFYPRAAALCSRETRGGRFDLVVECLNKLPFCAPLYAAVPVVALCHHLFGHTAFEQVAWPVAAAVVGVERLIPRVYRDAAFVGISESTRDDLVARGVEASRIEVQHPGIRPPAAPASPIAEREARLVYVGRLEPYKHVDLLLRVVARLAAERPELSLDVVGEGSDRPRLEALAQRLGVASRIRFTGFVDDEQRDLLLARARVCVCPSSKEGWGLTVVEANALGTPNVASDAPGLRDSVRHGETGFLAPPGDEDAFTRHVAALLSDDALATRMSEAARQWSRRFEWDAAAELMQSTLERASGIAAARDAAQPA